MDTRRSSHTPERKSHRTSMICTGWPPAGYEWKGCFVISKKQETEDIDISLRTGITWALIFAQVRRKAGFCICRKLQEWSKSQPFLYQPISVLPFRSFVTALIWPLIECIIPAQFHIRFRTDFLLLNSQSTEMQQLGTSFTTTLVI